MTRRTFLSSLLAALAALLPWRRLRGPEGAEIRVPKVRVYERRTYSICGPVTEKPGWEYMWIEYHNPEKR